MKQRDKESAAMAVMVIGAMLFGFLFVIAVTSPPVQTYWNSSPIVNINSDLHDAMPGETYRGIEISEPFSREVMYERR
jgi:hypothetical protein